VNAVEVQYLYPRSIRSDWLSKISEFSHPRIYAWLFPLKQVLVFCVTQFKIDQNKNRNRSVDKDQQDMRRNCFPKFIEICV